MSAESFARRAMLMATTTKAAAEVIVGMGRSIQALGAGLENAGASLFYIEADAARRYQAATDYDLGAASGHPLRYSDDPNEWAHNENEDD